MTAKNIIEVDQAKAIRWPSKCAYCSEAHSTEAKTHFRVIDGYFLIALRERVHTAQYPVCGKHKFTAKFYGFVTNQAWPTGFVMALIFPLLICLPLIFGTDIGSKFSDLIAAVSYILFAAWVTYLKMCNPVKVVKVKKGRVSVRILNEQYAGEFKRLNVDH